MRWDGLAWEAIAQHELEARCANFLHHRPNDDECLRELFEREQARSATLRAETAGGPRLLVSHGGCMRARA